MKKVIFALALILLFSSVSLAAESNETKISLSMGAYTGAMGFLVEQTFGLPAVYGGLGITSTSLRGVVGARLYMPDRGTPQFAGAHRSNVFIGPVIGTVIEQNVSEWDPEKGESVYVGTVAKSWGGITGGYDFNWGRYDEYHLTLEGGMGFNSTKDHAPYKPIFNISLGYSF